MHYIALVIFSQLQYFCYAIYMLLIYKKYAPFLWKKLGASNYSGAWGGLYAASVTEATINSLRSASLIQL